MTTQALNSETKFAGFWIRTLAVLIDVALLLPVLLFFLLSIYGSAYLTDTRLIKGAWDVIIQLVIPLILTVLLWKYLLATPGKLILGLQVVDANTLQTLTWEQSVVRYVAYTVSFLPLGLGCLWVAFDPKKQGWHDKLARSVVIHKAIKPETVKT